MVTSGTLPLQTFLGVQMDREIRLLSSWMSAASACLTVSDASCVAAACLSLNALLRPAVLCMSRAIVASEDAKALQLYVPLTRLVDGVAGVLAKAAVPDGVLAGAVKVAESLSLCFNEKGKKKARAATDASKKDRDVR